MRFAIATRLVAGCTCNGKDQIGLAPVKIEDDPTLRKGDIVAGANGLVVAGRSADKRGASLNFSPASEVGARALSARAGGGVGIDRAAGGGYADSRPTARFLGGNRPRGCALPRTSTSLLTRLQGEFRMLVSALITFLVVILILYLINCCRSTAAPSRSRASS